MSIIHHVDLTSKIALRSLQPPNEIIERVVRQMNAICQNGKLELAMSVGKLVIDEMYGGALDDWRSAWLSSCRNVDGA